MKRKLDVHLLSDIHLGTYGAQAEELVEHLGTVSPRMVIINGDIVDIWAFKKSYFPPSHMKVLKRLLKWANKMPVY